MKPTVDAVIVGSGLAGLTAALKLSQNNHKVILLEKTTKLGGNSMKASSGINGVPTRFQTAPDTVESFVSDSLKSGKGLSNPALINALTSRSAATINWLADEVGVDLAVVNRLGGHSAPRTHRGAGKLPPGVAIISALTKELDKYPNLTILKESPLVKIINESSKVTGVEYRDKDGNTQIIGSSNVILASGGFSADFTSTSLIKKYRPDLFNFPATNGEQTTGDGQKIAERDVEAKLIHMDQIQVHPTGFVNVDPEKLNDKWKFLCGELMRGIGGILISPEGMRFVNELDTRDIVSSAILENCSVAEASIAQTVAFLLVSNEDYKKAQHHIDFYKAVGLLHRVDFDGAFEFIRKFNPNLKKDVLVGSLTKYNTGTLTHDEFHRPVFGSTFVEELYIGAVTPVLHFDMGGIAIDEKAHVINKNNHIIPNLYAIGEVSGGVHGGNRLGGSSLLECVVFGTIAAEDIIEKS